MTDFEQGILVGMLIGIVASTLTTAAYDWLVRRKRKASATEGDE